jgi:hypothetical protein
MKLAEALVLRADVQRRVEQLRDRLRQSVLIQEGDLPSEDPQALLTALGDILKELGDLITQINVTNLQTIMADGTTLTAALARRDVLVLEQSVLQSVADTASNRIDRYSRSEIRRVATVDVAAMRRNIDDLARQRRELDTTIQATNWTTDLVERQ